MLTYGFHNRGCVLLTLCILITSGCGGGGDNVDLEDTDAGNAADGSTTSTNPGEVNIAVNDTDGDGILDYLDNCKNDGNANQADQDLDKVGDACDNCLTVANVSQEDLNHNDLGDICESGLFPNSDDDGDGVRNDADNCLWLANAGQEDADGDHLGDSCDNCVATANTDQADSDDDGMGDACQGVGADGDGDSVEDILDNCPEDSNSNQSDVDFDYVGDVCDNCRYIANYDQLDANSNDVGDDCEGMGDPNADGDGDGSPDIVDNCLLQSNADQADEDGDGLGNVCDSCPLNYDPDDLCSGVGEDTDGDGMSNAFDTCPLISGTVGDSNHIDPDSDNLGSGCDNCPNVANPGQEDIDTNTPEGAHCEPELIIEDGEACETASSDTNLIRPNLIFVIDESGSMADGAPTRESIWEDALNPVGSGGGGLADTLADGDFNLAAADFTTAAQDADSGTCSALPTVNMQLSTPDNYTDNPACVGLSYAECFQDAAQITPAGWTPTAAALAGTLDNSLYELNGNANGDPDSYRRSKAVLLVTDGVPTSCPNSGSSNTSPRNSSMRETLEAARELATLDTDPNPADENPVPVYVLGFDSVNEDMMQLIANAGDPTHPGPFQLCDTNRGYDSSGDGCICNDSSSQTINPVDADSNNARYQPDGCVNWNNVQKSTWYPIDDVASIVSAVEAIIARTASCDMVLEDNGAVTGDPNRDLITVQLTGDATTPTTFAEDATNGYTLSGDNLTLHGSACDALESAVQTDSTARVDVHVACACSLDTEICDTLDNNCDGQVDEGCSGTPQDCEDVHGQGSPLCCLPGVEVCNEEDDDCDSEVDEGCSPDTCTPAAEVCDNFDNNCNGDTDEGCGTACQPFVEICDGLDNVCDDQVDDGCLECPNPSNEICDTLDNDCDGQTDEGCSGGGGTI